MPDLSLLPGQPFFLWCMQWDNTSVSVWPAEDNWLISVFTHPASIKARGKFQVTIIPSIYTTHCMVASTVLRRLVDVANIPTSSSRGEGGGGGEETPNVMYLAGRTVTRVQSGQLISQPPMNI